MEIGRKIISKNRIKFSLLIIFISLVLFLGNYFGLGEYFSHNEIRNSVDKFGVYGPLIFLGIYVVLTIIPLFPITPITILSGILFGTFFGGIYSIIGATIGSIIPFLMSRYLGRSFVEELFHKRFPKLKGYDEKIEKHGFSVNAFLKIVPIFPFATVNYVMGVTKIKAGTFFISTFIGLIPGSFIIAYFGDSLVELNITHIIVSTVLFLILISIYPVYLWLKKKNHSISKSKTQE